MSNAFADVSPERPGRGSAVNQLQDRRLDLEVFPGCAASPRIERTMLRPGAHHVAGLRRATGSAYRCPTRVSSPISLCSVGSGRSALDASVHSAASTDSSPRRDEITRPLTKTKSPRSTSAFQSASRVAPTSASEIITCSRLPESVSVNPSCRVAKRSLRVPDEHDPAADPDHILGLVAGAEVPPQGMHLAGRVGPVHADRIRIGALLEQPGALLQTQPASVRAGTIRRRAWSRQDCSDAATRVPAAERTVPAVRDGPSDSRDVPNVHWDRQVRSHPQR